MNWMPVLRVLLYPVQFDQDPHSGLERVLSMIQAPGDPVGLEEYALAIRAGLASTTDWNEAFDMPQGDASVRAFLHTLLERLEALLQGKT